MSEQPLMYGTADASYQAAGGIEGIRRLVDDFYDTMDSWGPAQTIRRMHADDLTLSRDKLACFLSGWLAGRAEAVSGALWLNQHSGVPCQLADR